MGGNTAAVYDKPGQTSIEIRDNDVPEPKAGQVLVKFSHSGVCHSDLHLMQRDWPWMAEAVTPGRVGGHEGVGTVTKLGPDVHGIEKGQLVGVKWVARACLSCQQCLANRDGHCENQDISGGTVDGTFQQYAVETAQYLTPIPAGVPPQEASVILCAGVTIYKAIKTASLQHGEWLAIAGAGGGLGHLGIQYAKAMGYRVVAIDAPSKKQLCKDLGADVFVDYTTQDVTEAVTTATEVGAHAFIVANAAPASYKIACSLVRTAGTVVCVGIPGKPTPIDVDANLMILKDLRIRGSAVGTRGDTIEALGFSARKQVKPIIQVHKLDKLQDLFEQMKKGEVAGRMVVEIPA